MLYFKGFGFASPPRTGTTWFLKACDMAGLGGGAKAKAHEPPREGWNGLCASIVRNPYDWLVSMYSLKGGKIGVPAVDAISQLARDNDTLESFLRQCAREEGCVGRAFDAYRASTCMKLEDFPDSAISMLDSAVTSKLIHPWGEIRNLPPQNTGPFEPENSRARRMIMRAEREFCERYEYF